MNDGVGRRVAFHSMSRLLMDHRIIERYREVFSARIWPVELGISSERIEKFRERHLNARAATPEWVRNLKVENLTL